MPFSEPSANIVTLFVTSVLYGITTVTFFACIKALLSSNGHIMSWGAIQYTLTTTALIMFTVATLDIGVIVDRCIKIFINRAPQSMPAHSGIASWWSIVEFSNTVIQTFIGDAILIYRCWVVWNHRWLIVLGPAITCCIGTGCGIAATIVGSTSFHSSGAEVRNFIAPFLALTLATNIATSSLIGFCIWNIRRKSTPYRISRRAGGPISRAIRVTFGAGLLYTTAILILMVTYSTGHKSQVIIGRALVQIISIIFNLIIGSRENQKVSHTVASTLVPLDTMVIHQEVVISHDPVDTASLQSQRTTKGSKKTRALG